MKLPLFHRTELKFVGLIVTDGEKMWTSQFKCIKASLLYTNPPLGEEPQQSVKHTDLMEVLGIEPRASCMLSSKSALKAGSLVLCGNLERWDGGRRWEGDSTGTGRMNTYNQFMLLCVKNHHNIVK